MARKINGRNVERGIYETNGYIYVRLFPNGIEHKEYIGPVSEAGVIDAAHEKLHEMRKAIRAGKLGQQAKETRWPMSKAIEAYWDEEASKKPSAHSFGSYVNCLKPMFGEVYVDAMDYTHTIALRKALAARGNKVSTINKHQSCLRRIFNFLVDMKRLKAAGYVSLKLPEFNPAKPIKFKEETHMGDERPLRRRRVVSPEEFKHFLKFTTDRVKKICYLAAQTTLRKKDLKAVAMDGGGQVEDGEARGVQSKTQRGFDVPLVDKSKKLLQDGIDFTNFRKEFEKAVIDSGLPHFQFRDLRKSLPSILRQRNYDIKSISEILGHATTGMTEVYLPVSDKEKHKAVEDAWAFFDNAPLAKAS